MDQFQSDDLTFTVRNKVELTGNVSRITFHSFDATIKKIYPGLDLAGKGYSLTSLQNHVNRYYTICNCMGSLMYDEYKNAFAAAIYGAEFIRTYKSFEEFSKKSDDCLEFVIKFYEQTQTGISRQAHYPISGDQYFIHGPVGRGLEIDKHNSGGVNIIFVGGTGILPFMDLFAYIGRRILSKHTPRCAIFPDELFTDLANDAQFVVYSYFPTREDCIGIELLEAIEKLHKKHGKADMFKLNLSLTRKGGRKHNNEEIVELLSEYKQIHGRINKLWVCGPPVMNDQFQRLMPTIQERTGIDNEDYAIL